MLARGLGQYFRWLARGLDGLRQIIAPKQGKIAFNGVDAEEGSCPYPIEQDDAHSGLENYDGATTKLCKNCPARDERSA